MRRIFALMLLAGLSPASVYATCTSPTAPTGGALSAVSGDGYHTDSTSEDDNVALYHWSGPQQRWVLVVKYYDPWATNAEPDPGDFIVDTDDDGGGGGSGGGGGGSGGGGGGGTHPNAPCPITNLSAVLAVASYSSISTSAAPPGGNLMRVASRFGGGGGFDRPISIDPNKVSPLSDRLKCAMDEYGSQDGPILKMDSWAYRDADLQLHRYSNPLSSIPPGWNATFGSTNTESNMSFLYNRPSNWLTAPGPIYWIDPRNPFNTGSINLTNQFETDLFLAGHEGAHQLGVGIGAEGQANYYGAQAVMNYRAGSDCR